ncbi:unnamed protein product [Lactuca virosa]|uniref:Uncharacterized protein n=1 Tax=Lactuca virosa TaxID=75947 RepID=A0AAU9LG77_9ASTR|nr:unnamed protein product [Lactuca virosa]
MADESVKAKRQPSRLQRRAPASIQVTPVGHWNVAIPLLSPLVLSPEVKTNCVENMKEECRRVVNSDNNKIASEAEKTPIVYKKCNIRLPRFTTSQLRRYCSRFVLVLLKGVDYQLMIRD